MNDPSVYTVEHLREGRLTPCSKAEHLLHSVEHTKEGYTLISYGSAL